ncbi:unnamed protein product [Cladocopium goreaui]|uniref:Uncharacterized protein n=1 Tax=Cladocopium goreaui TaxID=2562237 RepID=A0A9P1DNQ8_9DINO|nr:unnamed protein product [Cladocopium goreaui]
MASCIADAFYNARCNGIVGCDPEEVVVDSGQRNIMKITLPTEMDAISTELKHTIQEPPVASLPAETPPSTQTAATSAEKWEAPHRKSRKNREMSRWERWMNRSEVSVSEDGSQNGDQEVLWLQDESEGLLSTVWYLIEEVLIQRPQLEAGKRVTAPWHQGGVRGEYNIDLYIYIYITKGSVSYLSSPCFSTSLGGIGGPAHGIHGILAVMYWISIIRENGHGFNSHG